MSKNLQQVYAANPITSLSNSSLIYGVQSNADAAMQAGYLFSGLSKKPCRVATITNLTATYNNGTAGVGATLTNSSTQAALVIDGITLAVGDRVFVILQDAAEQCGIYSVTNIGSVSTNWVLTRTTDFNGENGNIFQGANAIISQGSTLGGNVIYLVTAAPYTVGTTQLLFTGITIAMAQVTGLAAALAGKVSTAAIIDLAHGGTGAAITASNGGIFYSNGTTGALLSGTGLANRALLSGANSTPSFSTTTYPTTTTINQLLWSPTADSILGLATLGNGVLVTSVGGVPSISVTLPTNVQDNITRLGAIASMTTPLNASFGGTGLANPTTHGIMVSQGAGPMSPKVLTNGQVLIGSTGADPVGANITAGTGIAVTNAAGSLTIACTGSSIAYPPGYFTGCLLSFANTLAVNVASGNMVDSTNTYNLDFSAAQILMIQIGVSGIDVGTIGANKTYYVYIIGNSAGGVPNAPICSLSPTSPSFANAGSYNIYAKTPYRFQTNGSSQVINFIHTANIMQVDLVTTTKTLTQADANTFQFCSNASAQTITVPPVASVPWVVGDTIKFTWFGAGQPTITNGGGVSIYSMFLNGKIGASFTSAYLQYLGSDAWLLEGNLTA